MSPYHLKGGRAVYRKARDERTLFLLQQNVRNQNNPLSLQTGTQGLYEYNFVKEQRKPWTHQIRFQKLGKINPCLHLDGRWMGNDQVGPFLKIWTAARSGMQLDRARWAKEVTHYKATYIPNVQFTHERRMERGSAFEHWATSCVFKQRGRGSKSLMPPFIDQKLSWITTNFLRHCLFSFCFGSCVFYQHLHVFQIPWKC